MSLFDAWEKFYSQIYPQHYLDDEETKLIESNEETKLVESNEENIITELDDNSYCPATIAASQLVEYVIYIQNYLWDKKQN